MSQQAKGRPVTARDEAWDDWWMNVIIGDDTEDVAHEAFCAGWEVAAADPTTENEGFRAYKAGAAAERDSIIALASQLRASIPADHPPGAQASFADYLRVTAAGGAP